MGAKEKAVTSRPLSEPEHSGKDRMKKSDAQIIEEVFSPEPRTMMQATVITGIPTQYVCRYVGRLRKEGAIQVYRRGKCPITGWNGVQFLTTNPALFRAIPKQLNIPFDEQG
jgi:predicted transcriptional regulator